MDVLAAVGDLITGGLTLARDIGKGGGGSTEEPTVCISLLPVALGVGFVGLRALRRDILKRLEEGRPLRPSSRRGKSRQHRAWCPAQAGGGSWRQGPYGQGNRDVARAFFGTRGVKRGNPRQLQPQAWPLRLLAEARVEGTAPSGADPVLAPGR